MAYLSTGGDTFYNNVSLLLHMEGTNGSTTFTDNSFTPKTVTANGNAQLSTITCAFGRSSAYFDGTGDYLSIARNNDFLPVANENFTIEAWVYLTATPGALPALIAGLGEYGTDSDWNFQISSSLRVSFYINAIVTTFENTTPITLNSWNHVAVSRSGTGSNNLRVFVNGIGQSFTTNSTTVGTGNRNLTIGADQNGDEGNFTGYIDELRITKGVGRYTSNFTVPTAFGPFPDSSPSDPNYSNTSLLLHMDNPYLNPYIDNSINNLVVTPWGSAQVSNSIYKFGISSLYLNASSSTYLTTPGNVAPFQFGTGDFTIEGWFYLNNTSSTRPLISLGSYNAGILLRVMSAADSLWINNTSYNWNSIANFPLMQWNHVALVRSGTTVNLYINGNSVFNVVNGANIAPSTNVTIGSSTHFLTELWDGYIDDLRITKGVARYTSNFTPPTQAFPDNIAGDPSFNSVSLLMHYEGYSSNFTNFVDSSSSPKTITPSGDAKLSVTQIKFGSASAYFDGNTDMLTYSSSNDFAFGLGDFTVEFWIYVTGSHTGGIYASTSINSAGSFGLFFESTTLTVRIDGTGNDLNYTYTTNYNQWTFVTVTRASGFMRLFINGSIVASGDRSARNVTATSFVSGMLPGFGYSLSGYIDELRITKGVARYTSNFSLPTQAFPDNIAGDPSFNNVSLLCHFDIAAVPSFSLIDNSSTPKTTNSTAPYNTASSIFGPSSITCSSINSYATVQYSTDWDIGSFTNYTIEFWINYNTIDDNVSLMGQMSSNSNPNWRLYQTAVGNKLSGIFFNHTDGSGISTVFGWNNITEYVEPGVWEHIAIVKSSNTWDLYINGLKQGSSQTFTWTIAPTWDLTIGGVNNTTFTSSAFSLDDVRLTKNVARYTSDFIPTTAPFANYLTSVGNATVEPLVASNIANLSAINPVGNATVEPLQSSSVSNLPTVSPTGNKTVILYVSPPQSLLTTYGTGIYTISGTVVNGSSAPLSRTVIAYDRTTNIPEDVTLSDPVTGAFTLRVQNTNCYVVCLPLLSDGVNAEVFDNITPIGPV